MPTGAFAWPAGLVFGAGEEHGNTFTASLRGNLDIRVSSQETKIVAPLR
jgi:hypothetical protein